MLKKTISFTLIFLVILLIYQFAVNGIKKDHVITYAIEKEGIFNIEENYTKKNGDDYYLFKISNGDNTFIFEVENKFNKQKEVIKDIEIFNQNDYYCIAPIFVKNMKYAYPMCVKDNILYSYSSIKDKVDFGEFIDKIDDDKKTKYSIESSKIDEEGVILNKGYFDENEILLVYDYKKVSIHFPSFNRVLTFSSVDNYKNDYGTLVGEYYLIPKLSTLAYFNTYYKYDVVNGIKSEIILPNSISKQSYINGVYDDKLYIFDKSELKQYEINPKNNEVIEVGNTNDEAFIYKNGEKQSISVYELNKDTITFSENLDDYSKIDYDNIYLSDKFVVYEKNGNYYKAYKKYLDNPIYLFTDNDIKSVKVKYNNIYYVKDESIYKYNVYGPFAMAIKNEFKYNYDNIYDVYKY